MSPSRAATTLRTTTRPDSPEPPGPSRQAQLLALTPLRAVARLAVPTPLVKLVAATSNVLYTYLASASPRTVL